MPIDGVQLRTLDIAAARAFYAALLGPVALDIGMLPAAAVARGAVPHWLGLVGVEDAEATVSAFVARGATRLGPTGSGGTILRDPGGALIAVRTLAETGSRPAWHLLHTTDPARAAENYGALFGWRFAEPWDIGEWGRFQPFAWAEGGPAVGAVLDLAGRSGIHPQWLYFFAVGALELAMAQVRAAGGRVLVPTALPDGARVVVCEDPQGAAFGLWEGKGYTEGGGGPCPSS